MRCLSHLNRGSTSKAYKGLCIFAFAFILYPHFQTTKIHYYIRQPFKKGRNSPFRGRNIIIEVSEMLPKGLLYYTSN